MKLLAFDTSTEWCSAALWLAGEVRAVDTLAGQTHSQILLPMVQGLLAEAGLTLAGLDGLAYGQGPGSFTGLRIACGVAQGLAMGAALPVIGVSTLEAMAEETGHSHVVTCLDARVGEIYAALWRKQDALWLPIIAPALYRPQDAPLPEADDSGTEWIGCGSAFNAHAEVLAERYAGRLSRLRGDVIPHARAIVRLAAPRLARGEGLPAECIEPYYVRDKVALKRGER